VRLRMLGGKEFDEPCYKERTLKSRMRGRNGQRGWRYWVVPINDSRLLGPVRARGGELGYWADYGRSIIIDHVNSVTARLSESP
jgi:hypothetical protein